MIVRRFVVTDATPIEGFRGDARIAVLLGNPRVQLFSIGEFLLHEIDARQGHFQTRAKPVRRQIAFDAVSLDAFRIHDQHCRRPQRTETFEPRRMLLDVSFEGNERLIDKVRGFLIRV